MCPFLFQIFFTMSTMNKMINLRWSWALALLACPVMASSAQVPQGEETVQELPQVQAEPLRQDPLLLTGKFENGMSYLIRPTKEPAGRACLRLYVNTGSLNETEDISGVSHFLEHLVFNGSRHYERGKLIPEMQRMGLGFGGDANAYTSLLQTVYMLDLPNLKEETVDMALTIMRDFADGATLTDEAIDHERGIVVSELKVRDSASYRAGIKQLGQWLEGTRVTSFMPIGTEEVIRHVPYQKVRDYYAQNYVPSRMTLMIVGDIDPQIARQWVEKYFSSMTVKPEPENRQIGTLSSTGESTLIVANPELAHTTVSIAVVDPWRKKEDTLEQRIEDLPLSLACSMLNTRLSQLARTAESPFNRASVGREELFQAGSVFAMELATQPEQWRESLVNVTSELRKACEFGFQPVELQECIASALKAIRQDREMWETISASSVASALVASHGEGTLFTAPDENERALMAGVRRILGEPDLCRKALKQAFDAGRVKLFMSGTLPEGVTEEAFRQVFEAALKAEIQPDADKQALKFAYEDSGAPGHIVQQSEWKELGVTALTLSNGIRVNLKPLDFKKGSISVQANVEGGMLALSGTPGLAMLANSVMGLGGLEKHSQADLRRLLSSRNASLEFGSSMRYFTFSGRTDQSELEFQCQLLAAAILYPGFRPEGEMTLRRNLDTFYQRLNTTTQGAYMMQAPRLLYGNDSRFVVPTKSEMEALSTENVRQAMMPYLNHGAMEVSLVGDFKVEEVLPILERTFGAMPERSREFAPVTESQRQVTTRPWGQREFLRYDSVLDKTLVTQVRPAGDGMDRRRNRRLTVLGSIVRSKLFDGIRAELGESYSPSVRIEVNSDFRGAATLSTSSAGVKGNRVKVNTAMDLILQRLGTGDISQDDFDCAIRPVLASAERALREPGFWQESIAHLQAEPESVGLLKDMLDDVRSISLEEIQTLAREIFGSGKVNHYFTVPRDYDENAPLDAAAQPAEKQTVAVELGSRYAVIISSQTAADPDWKKVADTLTAKYRDVTVVELEALSEAELAQALRQEKARYAALVLKPEEISEQLIRHMHRAARQVDDDPWGDCIWGVVTGYNADDALRIASAQEPLVVKRLLGTTNVDSSRFEHSCCITDWPGSPVLEQTGYQKPIETVYTANTPEGQKITEQGMQGLFARQLAIEKPQLLVTSSHATQYNLEMPFGKGLVFPAENRLYQLPASDLPAFASRTLPQVMQGDETALVQLAQAQKLEPIEPDGTPRIWLAAGNCLFGDVHGSRQSMAVTALSAYTCNQVVGYTVPSWYGAGGWGTLSCFMDNVAGTSLAEAWFLNNQFILNDARRLDPQLMVFPSEPQETMAYVQQRMQKGAIEPTQENFKNAFGLLYDKDVVAFYGDPAWRAVVDESHSPSPYSVTWQGERCFILKANRDCQGRCAIWFPRATTGQGATGCDAQDAVFTNDFILFPALSMKEGESRVVHIR